MLYWSQATAISSYSVDLAQRQGIRVAVLGLEDAVTGISRNQSFEIICAADRVWRMGVAGIEKALAYVKQTSLVEIPAPPVTVAAQPVKKIAAKQQTAVAKKAKATKKVAPAKAAPNLGKLPHIAAEYIASAAHPFDRIALMQMGGIVRARRSGERSH